MSNVERMVPLTSPTNARTQWLKVQAYKEGRKEGKALFDKTS